MYQLLALANGVLLALMISINGNLSAEYPMFTAAVIIHIVGSILAVILCALQKDKSPIWHHQPKWMYLGGAIGVFIVVFQNTAFQYISITSVVALGLLGQTMTSLIVDNFGLFGMERRPLQKYSFIGLAIALVGIFMMLDTSLTAELMAVSFSFGAGVALVFSRTVNARLGEIIGPLRGSLVNHLVGLAVTLVLAVLFESGAFAAITIDTARPWIYIGGMLGVFAIMLLNIVVPRIQAFQLTLLLFIGQVFCGILLDIIVGNSYSDASFTGGIIIALGIVINMLIERAVEKRALN